MAARVCAFIVASVVVGVFAITQSANASGSFTDTFPGTSLDTNAWEDWPPGQPGGTGTSITVNNGVTLDANDGYNLDITTKTYKMGVGQQFQATLQILNYHAGGGFVSMWLTNNDYGTSQGGMYDTRKIGIEALGSNAYATIWKDTSGAGFTITGGLALNTTYKWEIERTGLDSAVFRVRDGSGTLLGSYTNNSLSTTFGGGPYSYPADMNLMLLVQTASAKFTEVTATPEPGCATLAIASIAFALHRHPRRRRTTTATIGSTAHR